VKEEQRIAIYDLRFHEFYLLSPIDII